MKKRTRRLGKILALVLTLTLVLTLISGCNRNKAPGAEVLDAGEGSFIFITLQTGEQTETTVQVRRMEQKEENGPYTVAETYTPSKTGTGDTYGLLVNLPGIYEVEAICKGYAPVSHVVRVEDLPVYVLELSPMPVIGKTTAP